MPDDYYWSELEAIGWPLPTKEDVDIPQTDNADYNSKLMDMLGKVFRDKGSLSEWAAIGPSDKSLPPLVLLVRELDCLRKEFNVTDPPSAIFRHSEVYSLSQPIMEKVCQSLGSINSEGVRSSDERFSRKPSYFLFFLKICHHTPLSSDSEASTRKDDEHYWTTVKFSPEESSLSIFLQQRHKPSFISNADHSLHLVNSTLRIIGDYWGYKLLRFSLDEISWIDDPLTKIDCISGAVNAMFLLSAISSEASKQIQHLFGNLEAQEVLKDLHEVLLRACGQHRVDPTRVKRKCPAQYEESRKKQRSITDQK